MHSWSLFGTALLVGPCVWLAAAPVPTEPQRNPGKLPGPCFGLSVATVHQGTVYTTTHGAWNGFISPKLWQAPLRLNPDGKEEGRSVIFRQWVYGELLDRLHWRIAHDHIWAECGFPAGLAWGHRIPMSDLPLLDVQNEKKGAAELRKKYGNDKADTVGWFMTDLMAPSSEVIAPILLGPGVGLGQGRELEGMVGDILPTGPNTWDFFLLHKSQLATWRCSEKPERDEMSGIRLAEGKRYGDNIDTGFQEPFFVYGQPEAPFFVTKSGKVFLCLRPEGKEPRIVKVWGDPRRVVTTVLNDADTNRTFVAGADLPEGPGKWFYFELAEKPERKPFDRGAMETTKAEEPLKSSLVFARFLVKEGCIKDRPK